MPPRSPSITPPIDTTIVFETPEHIQFAFPLAGPTRRAGAYLFDLFIRGVALLFVGIAFGIGLDTVGGTKIGLYLFLFFLVEWGYYVVCDLAFHGQSPGRRLLGIRVVTESGQQVSFQQSILRNLLRAADIVPMAYATGCFVMAFDRKFRRLGDILAGTIVIRTTQASLGAAIQISPAPTPQEWDAIGSPALIDGELREAIAMLLRRLPQLSPARANELAELLLPACGVSVPHNMTPIRVLSLLYLAGTARA